MLNYRKHIGEGLLLIFFLMMTKKWRLLKSNTHIKARVQKPYPIYDQNG